MSLEKLNSDSQIQSPPKPEKVLGTQSVVYRLESGMDVEVSSKEFNPAKSAHESNPHKAVILLPGLVMKPDDIIMKNLAQSYAESSQGSTYVVATKLEFGSATNEEVKKFDLMYEEARGIAKFIKEKGFTEVTLAGWSQGGDRAINVAYLLQNDSELKVNGLILLSPMGLYEQKHGDPKKNLIKDSLATPFSLIPDVIDNPKKYSRAFGIGITSAYNVISNVTKNLVQAPKEYPGKLKRSAVEMEKINPRIPDIMVPVVILTGAKDQLVKPGKIIPFEEEAKIEEDLLQRQAQRAERYEAQKKLGNENITDEQSEPGEARAPYYTREKYLKENLFKGSPFVKMVTGTKMGKHGLPVFRPEDVAEVSIGLLNRYNKE